MARTDAIVLGAGIVGTSVALHLAKKGLAVALVDKRGPGEETSYGNTGVIVGASVFPTAFPRSLSKLIQVALKRAPEANYHWGDLLKIAPWLYAYYGWSTPEKLKDSAVKLRPLMSRSVGYVLTEFGVAVNTQSSSILSVLVLGAGTDYALLIVSPSPVSALMVPV